ncbi:putative 4-amino-4-deoxy-L-arabinose-phosphoundecaprenol flippase subunit ArnE [Azospira sp. I13]|uniref:DMT family transporter n=1 Tax=Azospira sp. I13 TaxID=1765050 RepID=UPI000D473B29|nr:SMR family transporter [Azospira sp. I13]GBG03958.1 putative 4-amino-4-deoxy-L-arabinose-phosphoundecaprenol flippase subunit ArnE [Azospira sp. I13]
MSSDIMQGLALAIICTVMEGVAQVCLKKASMGGRQHWYWTISGLTVFALEALVYTVVLQMLAVSVAYPIGALGFVMVTLMSKWWLHEKICPSRWSGVGLIIAGAALVAVRA